MLTSQDVYITVDALFENFGKMLSRLLEDNFEAIQEYRSGLLSQEQYHLAEKLLLESETMTIMFERFLKESVQGKIFLATVTRKKAELRLQTTGILL